MGKAHPDFLLAVGVAKAAAVLWHEKHGLRIAEYGGARGQAAMVMFYLRNFAPEEFGGARREVGVPERPRVPAITPDTTPEEAMKLWEATAQ